MFASFSATTVGRDCPDPGGSFPGVVQSAQRAPICCVLMALQAFSLVCVGVDNLHVLCNAGARVLHPMPVMLPLS